MGIHHVEQFDGRGAPGARDPDSEIDLVYRPEPGQLLLAVDDGFVVRLLCHPENLVRVRIAAIKPRAPINAPFPDGLAPIGALPALAGSQFLQKLFNIIRADELVINHRCLPTRLNSGYLSNTFDHDFMGRGMISKLP